jgi:hypothetical protein
MVPAISIKKFIAPLRMFGISSMWISHVLMAASVSLPSLSPLKFHKTHPSAKDA